ncbi:hypothetical protein ACEQ6A_20915 [Rhizobium brockwellii]|uniref:hypothetical protein n=1 Tax=Rhizobium brockwellii TaxID=3019932 RepID=UPI003F96277B
MATRLKCTTSHLVYHAAVQQKLTANAEASTLVILSNFGNIALFFMQNFTDGALRALPFSMLHADGAAAPM